MEREGIDYITIKRPKKEVSREVKVEHYRYREGPEKVMTGCLVILTIAILIIIGAALKELTK